MATRFVKPNIDKYIQLYSKYARVEEGTFTGKVKSIIISNGGSGFTTAPTITISAPNITAGGVQATGTAVLTNGVITSITVNYPTNVGYTTPARITITGTSFKPVSTQIGFSIKSTSIEYGGNYTTVPFLKISPPDTVGQTQATATCTISNNKINSVTITNAGTGYNTNPIISIFNGDIGQISLTKAGQWYEPSNLPEVIISAPNVEGGIQATATAVIANTNGYELESINITNSGTGFNTPPTVSIVPPLYLVHTSNPAEGGSIQYGVVLNGGSGYTSQPTVQVELPDNPFTGQYRQATGVGIINAYGLLIGFEIQDIGKGYIARKQWTCNIFGGGGSGATGVFYNTYGFGAEAKAYLDESGGGIISAYITNGYGALAEAVLEVLPVTSKKYTWQLDTPIEVNENASIQIVERTFTGIISGDAAKPMVIRMEDISSQSVVNTLNISRNNTAFYQGKIIDIGQPIRAFPSEIKLEIQPQVIDRITLSLNNQGISVNTGISTVIEFFILLKITEKEPTMLEFGSLNNINTRQLNM